MPIHHELSRLIQAERERAIAGRQLRVTAASHRRTGLAQSAGRHLMWLLRFAWRRRVAAREAAAAESHRDAVAAGPAVNIPCRT